MVRQGGMHEEKSFYFLPLITACGFASTIGQIIILRELLVLFCGNEISIGLIFVSWLLWTALGSSVGGRCGARTTHDASVLPTALVLLALLLPASVLWIRATRVIWTIPTGEMIGPFTMLLISLAGTGLFCVTSGALFGLAWASLTVASEKGSAQPLLIYLGEAMGAAVGGLFFYFVLLTRASIFEGTLYISLIVVLLAALLFGVQRRLSLRRPASLAVVLVAFTLVAGALISSADLDRKSRHWQWGPKLLTVRDTPYQNLALLEDTNQFSLFANGLLLFSFPDPQTSEYAVHLAMLQHRYPRKVLLIGGGIGGLLFEVLKHPTVGRVDYVEPDPELIELVEEFLPGSATAALLDRRVHLVHADAGTFVRTADSQYDVVIMQLGDPVNAEINRFYTAEFYLRVARLLNPDGLLSFGISSSPDMIGPNKARLLQSVYHTLQSVFPGVLAVPGENARFLASQHSESLTTEPHELLRRIKERRLELQYVREYYLFDYLNPIRLNYLQAILGEPQVLLLNHDFAPTCYFNGLVVSTAQLHPLLGEAYWGISRLGHLSFGTLVGATIMGMLFLFACGYGTLRKAIRLNVLLVGGIEMVLEMVLLLGFQILQGFLYRQLALIIAFFMAGMSLGTGILSILSSRIGTPRRWLVSVQTVLALYLIGTLSLLYWLYQQLQENPQMSLPMSVVFSLLALAAGVLGGCHFALGVQTFSNLPGYSGATGPGLYALDLIGAAGGVLIASLVILPLFGIPTTMLVLTLLCLAGAATLVGK